jgi:hypothetical protein
MTLIKSGARARPYWLLIAAASLVSALLNAFTEYLNSRFAGRGPADWSAVAFAAALWLVFGALTPIPYVLARRYPLSREVFGRTLVAHLTGALMLNIGWASAGVFLALLLNRRPAQEPLFRYYVTWILTNLPWSVFLYFAVLGCIYAFTYYREARERESQDEIDWIEADDYYAAIHARQGSHLIRESLASLEQRLDSARFVRAHRSAIVNLERVRELRNESGETLLVLCSGVHVPVSRRRHTRVLRVLRRLGK